MADNKQEIKIELTPEIASGNYSNLAVISHTPGEFFIDFINVAPNMPQARVIFFDQCNPLSPGFHSAGASDGVGFSTTNVSSEGILELLTRMRNPLQPGVFHIDVTSKAASN